VNFDEEFIIAQARIEKSHQSIFTTPIRKVAFILSGRFTIGSPNSEIDGGLRNVQVRLFFPPYADCAFQEFRVVLGPVNVGVTAFPARRFQRFALGLHENRPLNHAVGAQTRCMEAVT